MPEAPEMQVVTEFLLEKLPGQTINAAHILKPSVVRSLAGDLTEDIAGRQFRSVERRGKFFLLGLSGGRTVVINPKLSPRCGNAITQLKANQRITSYCRQCQPGMLLKN